MTTNDQGREHGWEHIGRAAEHFAQRVARDATKFAERLQEHAGEFADDMSRDWRWARHRYRHTCRRVYREASAPEVQQIFQDIRTVLSDVLDGVDELIERMFTEPSSEGDREWVRVVANRDTECSECKRAIHAGDEALVRRAAEGRRFRCLECKEPSATPSE